MTAWRAFLCAWTLDRATDMLWTTILAWLASGASSPTTQGLILAAAVIPNVIVLLFGGASADKHGSARVAKLTTVLKVVLLAILWASELGSGPLLVLALVAACLGAVDGFHDPAVESWGMRLRGADEQREAAATEATLWRVAQTLGAVLGGILLGAGAVVALSVALALYLVQRVFLGVMDRTPDGRRAGSEAPEAGSARAQIGKGLRFLRARPALWATMSMQTTCTLTVAAVLMLLAPLVVREQGWPAWAYGIAAGAFGFGMATGAGWVMKRQKSGRSRRPPGALPYLAFALAAVGHLPLGVLIVAPSAVGPVGLAVVLLAFGLLVGPVSPTLHGFRREQTPKHLAGVVTAAARLVVYGPEPLAPLAAGTIVALGGTKVALGAIVVVAAVVAALGAVGGRISERVAAS